MENLIPLIVVGVTLYVIVSTGLFFAFFIGVLIKGHWNLLDEEGEKEFEV